MVVLQVHTKCIKTKYKVRFLSKGTLVFVLTSVVSLVLPFIIAYKTKGFWLKRDVFYETPAIRFKGKYLLMVTTNNIMHPITCSSYPFYISYMKSFLSCSQIKVREVDKNNDKKIDELSLNLKINLPEKIEIYSLALIVPLELKLHTPLCPLEMQTEMILQQHIQSKCSNLTLLANLNIRQSSPLYCSSDRINTAFNYSSIGNEEDIRSYKLENILKQHIEKNLTTTVSDIYTIQEDKNKNHFMLNIKIRYSEQKFYYKPKFLQIIKWAWIQYYAIYIIIYYITNKIKTYIFENRLVLYYENNPIKLHK